VRKARSKSQQFTEAESREYEIDVVAFASHRALQEPLLSQLGLLRVLRVVPVPITLYDTVGANPPIPYETPCADAARRRERTCTAAPPARLRAQLCSRHRRCAADLVKNGVHSAHARISDAGGRGGSGAGDTPAGVSLSAWGRMLRGRRGENWKCGRRW